MEKSKLNALVFLVFCALAGFLLTSKSAGQAAGDDYYYSGGRKIQIVLVVLMMTIDVMTVETRPVMTPSAMLSNGQMIEVLSKGVKTENRKIVFSRSMDQTRPACIAGCVPFSSNCMISPKSPPVACSPPRIDRSIRFRERVICIRSRGSAATFRHTSHCREISPKSKPERCPSSLGLGQWSN